MTISSKALQLAIRSTNDPLYPAAQLLFARSFDPEIAAERLTAQKDLVIRYCFDILETEDLNDVDAPGKGYAPLNAVQLLAAWQVQAAVPRMWHLVENPNCDEMLLDAIVDELCAWESSFVDALLPFMQTVPDSCRSLLGTVLTANRPDDPRVREWVWACFENEHDENAIVNWTHCLLIIAGAAAIPQLRARILDQPQYSAHVKAEVRSTIDQYLWDTTEPDPVQLPAVCSRRASRP